MIGAVLRRYGADVPRPSSRQEWVPMRCPFHGDEQASAAVNFTAGRFICHGCMRKSEDAVGLIRWAEDIGFHEAQRRCKEVTGSGDGAVRASAGRKPGIAELFS